MKKIVLLLVGILLLSPLGMAKENKSNVSFNNQKYELAYSEGAKGIWLNEYLLPGETLNAWTKMVALRTYGNAAVSPKEAAIQVARNLMASNPQAKYAMHENSKTGEVLLDFVTWDRTVEEFNAFKFATINGGLVSLQFAFRTYNDVAAMEKFMKTQRTDILQKFANMKIPEVQEVTKLK